MAEKKTDAAAKATAATSVTGQPQGQALEVTWDDSQMVSTFANVVNAASTREEVTPFFGTNQTWNVQDSKKLKVQLSNRVILTPFAAKRLSMLLGGIVQQYEARFGVLDITPGKAAEKE